MLGKGDVEMRELSLNVMDIVQNSIAAGASLIVISVLEDPVAQELRIGIEDNGRGMGPEQLEQVQSPFYSTRTTRKIGLGVPFFKMSCEMTGGHFSIASVPGEGTKVEAVYKTGHIDMMPVGDMNETILLLVTCNPDLDFVYTRSAGQERFTLDTRELREVLGEDVPLGSPDVVEWIRAFLREGQDSLEESL